MSGLIVYPSKFTTLRPEEGVLVSSGDLTITTLFDIYCCKTAASRSWRFQDLVLSSAVSLFGDFSRWLNQQIFDANLVGNNRKFLEETIDYIHGKPRTLSVLVWKDIMVNYNGSYHSSSVRSLIDNSHIVGRGLTTAAALSKWVSQRNGFDDLLLTLYVMFGKK